MIKRYIPTIFGFLIIEFVIKSFLIEARVNYYLIKELGIFENFEIVLYLW